MSRPEGGGWRASLPLWGVSPWERERWQITFESSTLTFTKKTSRHFSIIYRAEGDDAEGKLHLITVVYSLHPLDKFTSLKEISRSFGLGWGEGVCRYLQWVWLSSTVRVLLSLFQ